MKYMFWSIIFLLILAFGLQEYERSSITLDPDEAEHILIVMGLTRVTIYPANLAEVTCGEGENAGLMFSAHTAGDQLVFGTVCKSFDNVPLTIRFNTE